MAEYFRKNTSRSPVRPLIFTPPSKLPVTRLVTRAFLENEGASYSSYDRVNFN